jgi:hypothetical protein
MPGVDGTGVADVTVPDVVMRTIWIRVCADVVIVDWFTHARVNSIAVVPAGTHTD